MLLERLESGFLLFETPQGLVRAELSLRQRIRLLWTFRHFRQLSIPLLNERERTLVNALFQHHALVVSSSDHASPVIGIIENFVPPVLIEAQTEAHAELQSESLSVLEPIQQEQVEERTPVAETSDLQALATARFAAAEEAAKVDLSCAVPKGAVASADPAISLKRYPDASRFFSSACKGALQKLVQRPLAALKLATSTVATIIALLSIGLISVFALHRVLAAPASQVQHPALVQSYEVKANVPFDSSLVAKPATIAESRAPISEHDIPAQSTVDIGTVSPAAGHTLQREPRARVSAGPRLAGTGQSPVTTRFRVQRAAATPNTALAIQETGIQATRPPLHFIYPVYRDVRARGKVALTARVEADGKVRNVRVVSGNRALAAAAVRAVRVWRYRPYVVDGQPVVTETNIVFSFFADDAISMTYPPSLPSIQ
jgi:TonB family protein